MSASTAKLLDRFCVVAGLEGGVGLVEVAAGVQALAYGRSPERTAESALESGRGTCSTKHNLLAALIGEGWPEVRVDVVHRVYRLLPAAARRLFGDAASAVPEPGLVDVHTFLVVDSGGGPMTVDVTFPDSPAWDGRSSMVLAGGPGLDVPAGPEPEATKAALVAEHCDPRVREPFIAALAAAPRPVAG
jgi:hypothetical protein